MTTRTIYPQERKFGAEYINEHGETEVLKAVVRHDDRCENGHNTFSVTASLYVGYVERACGCLHDEICERIPELAPFIKWHLCSTDGPLHYVANTVYHVNSKEFAYHWEGPDLDAARRSAIWPDATDEALIEPWLEQRLADRLPALLEDFQAAVESLGLTY